MKTIIAPTDFTPVSLNAVDYAADLATMIPTNLTILHVIQAPLPFSEGPDTTFNIVEETEEAGKQIQLLKEKIIYRTGGKIRVSTEVKEGDVVNQVGKYAAKVNAYAVVMGAESTVAFERFLLGGKTFSAMKELSWPLIIVPPNVAFKSIRKIGLACDFRNVTETIPVEEITTLVNKFQAELHVLHVSNEPVGSFPAETVEQSGWFQDLLGKLQPRYHFITGKDIEDKLCEYAEVNNFDLLIVIPKKHNLLGKIFQHSHSRRLVLHTHVPVLAIHE